MDKEFSRGYYDGMLQKPYAPGKKNQDAYNYGYQQGQKYR